MSLHAEGGADALIRALRALPCTGCDCSKALCLEYRLIGKGCCPDCRHLTRETLLKRLAILEAESRPAPPQEETPDAFREAVQALHDYSGMFSRSTDKPGEVVTTRQLIDIVALVASRSGVWLAAAPHAPEPAPQPTLEGVRYCNCADPENCREPIPGYACRPRAALPPPTPPQTPED